MQATVLFNRECYGLSYGQVSLVPSQPDYLDTDRNDRTEATLEMIKCTFVAEYCLLPATSENDKGEDSRYRRAKAL
jgi:hypothetical protein